ncbi:MAG: transglutaminase family protein [Verrucomicrobiota bacterium]
MSEPPYRYQISHRTVYQYSGRIDLCHSLARLEPRQEAGQVTESQELLISPEPDYLVKHPDYLGNTTHHLSIQKSHKALEVESRLTVRKEAIPEPPASAGVSWDYIEADYGYRDSSGVRLGHFMLPSDVCPFLNGVRELVKPSLVPGRDLLDVAGELMTRIYTDFDYTPGATTTTTPLTEVMETRKGVCQDFAHVMIAALRSAGVPTRYVSGYLETVPPPGKEKLRGSDASHAWVEVWTPRHGWVGFDPTNDQAPGSQYIKICHGRDYFDVQPIRGMFIGSGTQTLRVGVDVQRL